MVRSASDLLPEPLVASGGCAAKYPAARLRELLAGFVGARPDDLLVGLESPDDAAVYRLDESRALVFTVDFFPPLVDDPGLFGEIAATNALSDVFAMGGRPLLALSVAAFPEELGSTTVQALLAGARDKVAEAGAILAGGHTIRASELAFGLAVAGTVHPESIWRKEGARPGDLLYLTKPLGTGLVLAGAKEGVVGVPALREAQSWMTALSGRVAERLQPFEPTAVTDVTGFGLFGHADELARASDVRLILEGGALPWLAGAREAAGAGLRTGGDRRNREYVQGRVRLSEPEGEIATLGFDAQTAGGLLFSVPAAKAVVLETTFAAEELFLARIGRVETGEGIDVR